MGKDTIMAISEPYLIYKINSKNVSYVFVTPKIYYLFFYLSAHPNFTFLNIIDDIAIFKVNGHVKSIHNFSKTTWQACIGLNTQIFFSNLRKNYPEKYKSLLEDDIIPWKNLSKKELEELIANNNCVFDENFPGDFSQYSYTQNSQFNN